MRKVNTPDDALRVPPGYPTATVFIDESGSRASSSRYFVMAALKTRRPGELARELRAVRDKTNFTHEFKFSEITSGALPAYYAAADAIGSSDAHVAATVANRDQHDPFPKTELYQAHADVATQLLVGCINRRELVSVILDLISTPEGVAVDEIVRRQVNKRLRNTSVVTALCADSRSMDLLQMADMIASAIAFERRRAAGESGRVGSHPNSPKAKVAARLMVNLGMATVEDQRSDRINIATLKGPRMPLKLVRPPSAKRIETVS